ncbi:hypothetical protein A4A49_35718, partial [Nicotiana attenuata]
MVDKELAKSPAFQPDGTKFPTVQERVQWRGGRLWSDQREEDSEADEVPEGAKVDEEQVVEEQEEGEQSINDHLIAITDKSNATNLDKGNEVPIDQEIANDTQEANSNDGPSHGESAGRGVETVDPGGTEEVNISKKMIETTPNKAQMATIPLKSSQLKLLNRGGEHAVIPKFQNTGKVSVLMPCLPFRLLWVVFAQPLEEGKEACTSMKNDSWNLRHHWQLCNSKGEAVDYLKETSVLQWYISWDLSFYVEVSTRHQEIMHDRGCTNNIIGHVYTQNWLDVQHSLVKWSTKRNQTWVKYGNRRLQNKRHQKDNKNHQCNPPRTDSKFNLAMKGWTFYLASGVG